MTLKIKLSTLAISADAFAERVAKFVIVWAEYAAHLEGVKADENDETIALPYKRVAFPPPSEEPIIEQAAHHGYEFEGPSLEEKKAALTNEVRRRERDAHEKIMPAAKQRHWEFRRADIDAADQARYAIDRKNDPELTIDFHEHIAATRSPEDSAFMNEHGARCKKIAHISRIAAKHEHDISDLTEESVDHYVVGGEFA